MVKAILRVSVGLKAPVETQNRIEQSDHVGQTSLEVMAGAMKNLFQMADHRHQRQSGFAGCISSYCRSGGLIRPLVKGTVKDGRPNGDHPLSAGP